MYLIFLNGMHAKFHHWSKGVTNRLLRFRIYYPR